MWSVVADAYCVTTNGVTRKDGRLVMGAGVAKDFNMKFKGVDRVLGSMVESNGNNVYYANLYDPSLSKVWTLNGVQYNVVSFPTKHHWSQPSDLGLIEKSAKQLKELADVYKWTKIVIPMPGCGLGGLKWNDVQEVLIEAWGETDDRFIVVSNA